MNESTVTSKGQITIPQEIRRALGIRQGSRVAFAAKNGAVALRVVHSAPAAVKSGFGMLGARGKQVPASFDAASLLAPQHNTARKTASEGGRTPARASTRSGQPGAKRGAAR